MIALSVKDTATQPKSKLIKPLFPSDAHSTKQDFTFNYKIRIEWNHAVFHAERNQIDSPLLPTQE